MKFKLTLLGMGFSNLNSTTLLVLLSKFLLLFEAIVGSLSPRKKHTGGGGEGEKERKECSLEQNYLQCRSESLPS